jgi:hypothetical protein
MYMYRIVINVLKFVNQVGHWLRQYSLLNPFPGTVSSQDYLVKNNEILLKK